MGFLRLIFMFVAVPVIPVTLGVFLLFHAELLLLLIDFN